MVPVRTFYKPLTTQGVVMITQHKGSYLETVKGITQLSTENLFIFKGLYLEHTQGFLIFQEFYPALTLAVLPRTLFNISRVLSRTDSGSSNKNIFFYIPRVLT